MEKTPEQRIKEFIDGFQKLRDATKVDIFFYPMFVPGEDGTFRVVVEQRPIDILNQPVKSPEQFIP